MILTVEEFKTRYLRDKALELFPTEGDQEVVDDPTIEKALQEAEIRVSLDTGFTEIPDTDHFRYAIAMYCLATRVSSGIITIHSDGETKINTYMSNYKDALKKLKRKIHGWHNNEQ